MLNKCKCYFKQAQEWIYRFMLVGLKKMSMRVAIASYSEDIPRCLIILYQPTPPDELKNMKEYKDTL